MGKWPNASFEGIRIKVNTNAVYTVLGFTIHGQKEVLGLYLDQNKNLILVLS